MNTITENAPLATRITHARHWLKVCVNLRHRQGTLPEILKQLNIIHEGTTEMAKNVKKSNNKELKKAEFKGFANVELNHEEKAEMRAWIQDTEAVQVELDEMLASLYKISVQKSEALGAYQATAFAADGSCVNAGMILSAYAPHWWDAMAALAYKHAVKCEGVWNKDGDKEPDMWG